MILIASLFTCVTPLIEPTPIVPFIGTIRSWMARHGGAWISQRKAQWHEEMIAVPVQQ